MNIQPMKSTDATVLELFSQHDDFMIEFLGEDSHYYTRYTENENIENVWVVYVEKLPVWFGLDGIWWAMVASEVMAVLVTVALLIIKKKYGCW